jgi:hypothetical protein
VPTSHRTIRLRLRRKKTDSHPQFCSGGLRPSKFLSTRIAAVMIGFMSVAELKREVSRLSRAEQLQAMEWLWASLSKKPEKIKSPEWHGEVLAARKAKADSGEAQFLSVSQLKERLGRRSELGFLQTLLKILKRRGTFTTLGKQELANIVSIHYWPTSRASALSAGFIRCISIFIGCWRAVSHLEFTTWNTATKLRYSRFSTCGAIRVGSAKN